MDVMVALPILLLLLKSSIIRLCLLDFLQHLFLHMIVLKKTCRCFAIITEVVQADVRTINRNGYNWMVTFSSFDTVDVSYEMKVNTAFFGAAISGDVTVKSVNTYVIDTDSGVPTFATVAAKNSYGEGYSTTSDPASGKLQQCHRHQKCSIICCW